MAYFGEDQELILDSVKEFCADVIAPRVETDLEKDKFPMDILESMREMGYVNSTISEEWGGMGESMLLHCAMEKEVAKVNLSMALAGCSNPIATLIERVGTPEQKEAFMPGLVAGQGGLGFTEPTAGSDSAGIQSVAVKDGNEWVINGQKTFISYVGIFDWYLISARTNETGEGGISAFLVHKDTPGFKVGSMFHKLGMHGSCTGELFLEDVRVSELNLIGQENRGLHGVLAVLDEARMGTASCAVGIAEAALEKAVEFAKQRVAFGKPIAKFQGISWYLAEMEAKVDAARALLYDVAQQYDEGKNITAGAAKAKWFAGQVAVDVADRAVQICGGYGLTEDFGVARLYRDARVIPIIEGTDEVLKIVIARSVLK